MCEAPYPEAAELARALGVDADRCRRIVIDIPADAMAVAYAEMWVTPEAQREVTRILKARGVVVEIVEAQLPNREALTSTAPPGQPL